VTSSTRYVRTSDGTHVAFNITGQGPIDLLVCTEWTLNVDLVEEHPALSRRTERLGSSARVISMNRRGTGASDPLRNDAIASVDDWVIDATAVLNAALAPRWTAAPRHRRATSVVGCMPVARRNLHACSR
jgi:hypothetical protein